MSIAMIQAFKKSGLPPTARYVGIVLADHHNDKTGQCNPSMELLEFETGLARSTISAAIQLMIREGHLSIKKGGKNRNFYLLHPVEKEGRRCPGNGRHNVRETDNITESNVREMDIRRPGDGHYDVRETNTRCPGDGHPYTIEPEGTVKGTGRERERERAPAGAAVSEGLGIPPVTIDQAKAAGPAMGVMPDVAEAWWHSRNAAGWLNKHGNPIYSWRSDLTGFGRVWQDNEGRRKAVNGHHHNGAMNAIHRDIDPKLGF